MGRAARTKRRDKQALAGIRAAEPGGPIRCNAELVSVEAGIEAAEGRAATRPSFNILAYTGGLLRVGWSRPLVVDLAGLRANRTTILLDHEASQIVGQGQATIADGKLTIAGEITGNVEPGTPAGQVVSHARNGFVWAASIGVSPERVEPVDANQSVQVNGREFSGPIYVVRAGRLGEVSFVGVGADEQATATIAAQAGTGVSHMTFAQWLQAKNLNESRMTAVEYESLHAQYLAEHPVAAPAAPPAAPPPPAVPPAAASASARIDAEIAEGRRRQAIADMALAEVCAAGREPLYSSHVRDLATRAIEAGTTVRDFEVELLRARRPRMPEVIGDRIDEPNVDHVLQAAAFLAAGVGEESVARDCGERSVDTALRRFRGGITLGEIVLSAANSNGYIGRQKITTGNWREIVGWAIPDRGVRASGMSSIDLSGILGNVANKAMAAVAAEPQWNVPKLCGIASHTNFHAHTIYSLAMNGELKPVGPTGEVKHLNLSDESYTRTVQTRAALLRLSRQDLVNDDLGFFQRNAQALARKAFTTREKIFFTLLMASGAGSSHFTAAHGNYLTGATTAFGTTGLEVAMKGFRGLTGPDGDPIMVEPSILLVPPTLEYSARSILMPNTPLLVSGYTGTSAKTMTGSGNPFAGKFGAMPLTSPYLEATSITGYSAAYWYMFADPSQYPCYEIAYLNGVSEPVTEYFGMETDPTQLGVAWRVVYDFGVAAAEWRAGVKLAGS
jgi:hypothetical protein